MHKRDFSAERRDALAESGQALPDGSFPIATRGDLRNAVRALGRAKDPAKAKAHIISRAHAMGCADELPDGWVAKAGRFEIAIPFCKADDERQTVAGWASVIDKNGAPVEDSQGDIITERDLTDAAHRFVADMRTAKAMHRGPAVGEVVESAVFTKAMQDALGIDLGHTGWWVCMKIHDPATWARVKSGELRAFSIGGRGKRRAIDGAATD